MTFTKTLLLCSVSLGALASPALAQDGGDKDEIIVTGQKNYATVPLDSYTTTKSSLPILDTPATIAVIERDLIDAQLAVSLQEVIRNASGLNQAGNNYGVGDYLSSRGLPISYGYDGLYGGAGIGPDGYAPTRSLANVERIEVLQGANATVYGAGSAGGIVNIIEKKPQYEEAYNLELRAGSYDTYGATVDATGPINDVWAYRLVGSVYRKDGFRDLSTDRNEAYGSLSAKTSNNSLLTLSLGWLDDSVQVDSVGYPVRIYNSDSTTPSGLSAGEVTAANLPNDTGTGIQLTDSQIQQLADSLESGDGITPYDLDGASLISPISRPNEGEEFRLKARWQWEAAEGLTITPSMQLRSYDSEYVRQTGAYNYVYWNRNGVINAEPRAPLVVDDILYPFAARRQEYRKYTASETSWDNFLDVQYKHNISGMESETLLTAYYQTIDMDVQRASLYDADSTRSEDNPLPYIYDIRDPNFATGAFEDYDTYLSTNYEKSITSKGVGLQNIMYVRPWLITRAGVGFNAIDQDYDAGPTDAAEDQDPVDQSDSGFVYNLGATVKPNEALSTFVAYGQGRTSYSLAGSLNGVSDRPDSESTNFELGLKLQALGGRVAGGVSYFDTSRTNLRYENSAFVDDTSDPDYNVSVDEYFFDGEDTTKGVQVDLNAQLTDTIFININATHQDARNRQNPTSTTSFDEPQKGVPNNLASVYAVYAPDTNIMNGNVRFSLGYEYQDVRTIASTGFGLPDAILPEQGVWDFGIEYEHESQWSTKLQISNLTDELAYQRALYLGGLPIAPRSFDIVIRKSW